MVCPLDYTRHDMWPNNTHKYMPSPSLAASNKEASPYFQMPELQDASMQPAPASGREKEAPPIPFDF